MPKRQETPQSKSIMARIQRLTRQLAVTPDTASQLVLTLYIQEAFLLRLIASPFYQDWDLGGSQRIYRLDLLRGLIGARPTQDIDFRYRHEREIEEIRTMFAAITSLQAEDGVSFDAAIQIKPILAQTRQKGLQVRVDGYVGVAKATLWCDLSFGSPLVPGRELLVLPRLLHPEESLTVFSYPIESVLAGKMAALLERGNQDSRAKDYYDVWFLALHRTFAGDTLRAALEATCAYQGVSLDPDAEAFASPTFLTDARQLAMWERFIGKLGTQGERPTFAVAIEKVRALYGPVLRGEVQGKQWDHTTQRWQ